MSTKIELYLLSSSGNFKNGLTLWTEKHREMELCSDAWPINSYGGLLQKLTNHKRRLIASLRYATNSNYIYIDQQIQVRRGLNGPIIWQSKLSDWDTKKFKNAMKAYVRIETLYDFLKEKHT